MTQILLARPPIRIHITKFRHSDRPTPRPWYHVELRSLVPSALSHITSNTGSLYWFKPDYFRLRGERTMNYSAFFDSFSIRLLRRQTNCNFSNRDLGFSAYKEAEIPSLKLWLNGLVAVHSHTLGAPAYFPIGSRADGSAAMTLSTALL